MELYIQFFPRLGKVSAIISLKKLPAPFFLLSFWDTHCLMLLFLTKSNISSRISLFFKALNCFTFSTCNISRFLSYNFLILSLVYYALFPVLSNAFYILIIKLFSSRISVWFLFCILISLVKYLFNSLILFLSSLTCLSQRSYCS